MNNAQQRDRVLAERLLWVFRRSGEPGAHTMPFHMLEQGVQDKMQEQLRLRASEIPVVACFCGSKEWTVQTTQRLLWRDGSGVHELANSEIADATVDVHALRAAGSKSRVSTLRVQTESGESITLRLEPGAPFSGFWNVVKTIASTRSSEHRTEGLSEPTGE